MAESAARFPPCGLVEIRAAYDSNPSPNSRPLPALRLASAVLPQAPRLIRPPLGRVSSAKSEAGSPDFDQPADKRVAVIVDLEEDEEARLNGETRQSSSTDNLIFPVPELVAFISHVMTLEAGDLIATGTPAGIAPMERGDTVEVEIEGIGVLKNRVV